MSNGTNNFLQINNNNSSYPDIETIKDINLYSDNIGGNKTISLTSSSGNISANQFNKESKFIF